LKKQGEGMEKRAVILLSGGLDSTTVLAMAKREGYALYCLTFRYQQRHVREVAAARQIAELYGAIKHNIIDIDLAQFGGSALTDKIDVPKGRCSEEMEANIPVTYVPARNTIFLSYALAWAEVLDAPDIFIGVNAIDYSGYPDCRPEYIKAFEIMANLAIKKAVEGKINIVIRTPLLRMTKGEIIRCGIAMNVDYSLTHSCYDPLPDGKACGSCDSCLLRARGFFEAGQFDPLHTIKYN
jgi:7-cyano-7-deazaguanine synthase